MQRSVMTTMLRLKNIRIGSEYAEADFYPEDSQLAGHIVVDISAGDIASCVDVPGYGDSYRGHALQRIIKMAQEQDRRTECCVMWY